MEFTAEAFAATGVPPEDARKAAEALVDVARQALHFGRLDAEAILETRLLEHALDVLGGP